VWEVALCLGQLDRDISLQERGVWVDLGDGTGSNLKFLGARRDSVPKVYLVDLSPSLLVVAAKRGQERGWKNVEAVWADATTFQPPEGPADLVTLSYSLTMIESKNSLPSS
jgi:S-adenosylmethionine-diacylgycerolhomoserine-N-methlytransferase